MINETEVLLLLFCFATCHQCRFADFYSSSESLICWKGARCRSLTEREAEAVRSGLQVRLQSAEEVQTILSVAEAAGTPTESPTPERMYF